MHDPCVLVAHVGLINLDVWHRESGNHDAGELCGYPPNPPIRRLAWTVRHARHLYVRWQPYLNIRRWVADRCDGCGRRFHWREARYSYQSAERRVWHDPCMSLRHVRSQLDDITNYLLARADSNARWRVEYRLKGIEHKETVND